MEIKAIVVDDEPLARKGLLDYLRKVDFMTAEHEFDNAIAALQFLKNNKVDIVFLDINMPNMDGLTFVKTIKSPPLIVFTTAYREYAVESYEFGGFDYLVKPITFERFNTTCQRVLEKINGDTADVQFDKSASDHFFIKKEGVFLKISFEEILYISGYKDFIKIHLKGKMHLALISLKSVESKLPVDTFMRVHKSYVINKNKVISIDGNMLDIDNDKIPIGKTYRESVMAKVVGSNLWRREHKD